jgi:hypothetical protein
MSAERINILSLQAENTSLSGMVPAIADQYLYIFARVF